MNNIQQTRIQLEKTYHAMGGKELEEDSASVLNQLQSRLNLVLDELARIFATRYFSLTNSFCLLLLTVFLMQVSLAILGDYVP
jgi:hypothetical protein